MDNCFTSGRALLDGPGRYLCILRTFKADEHISLCFPARQVLGKPNSNAHLPMHLNSGRIHCPASEFRSQVDYLRVVRSVRSVSSARPRLSESSAEPPEVRDKTYKRYGSGNRERTWGYTHLGEADFTQSESTTPKKKILQTTFSESLKSAHSFSTCIGFQETSPVA